MQVCKADHTAIATRTALSHAPHSLVLPKCGNTIHHSPTKKLYFL
jgi:hypothetical protein